MLTVVVINRFNAVLIPQLIRGLEFFSHSKLFAKEFEHSVSKYNVKVKEGNTEIDETVEIDTENEIEKIHIPSNGDTSESAPGEVDVVFDFKLVRNREELGE
ncbi:hypothetical protein P5673_032938 [Acropora cervicornis]|uniref:Uncharacterized protein n=1 Tax=Acropora cervicornis TaxID=6130 RepID=A0AAD9PQW6_ACRCE|nr:hypothetical protein P5673_032938 [Acropora cervicornis]